MNCRFLKAKLSYLEVPQYLNFRLQTDINPLIYFMNADTFE